MNVYKMPENKEDTQRVENKKGGLFIAIAVIIGLWILGGISAFIASIVCFGLSGTVAEKVIGFVLAVLVGPFYWIYFAVNKNYCG